MGDEVATPGLSYTGTLTPTGANLIIADGNALSIVNVQDPWVMYPQGYLMLPGACRSLAINDLGTYAFCAVEDPPRMVVVNIVNVLNPTIVGTPVTLNGTPKTIVWASNHVFVAVDNAGLAVIDVTNPQTPGAPLYADTPGRATGVAVNLAQNLAMVADGANGVARINIAGFTPVYISNTATTTSAVQVRETANNFAVTQRYPAADSTHSIVQIYDQNGNPLGQPFTTAAGAFTTTLLGNTGYICEGDYGIQVVNFGVTPPQLTGTYREPLGGPRTMARSGNIAYVANYMGGLGIVDLGNIQNPVELATVPTGGRCYDVFVNNGFAFALDFDLIAIKVFRVTNPQFPVLVNTVSLTQGGGGFPRSMAYLNGYVYVGFYNGSPTNLHLLTYQLLTDSTMSFVATGSEVVAQSINVKGVTAQDGRLFVAASDVSAVPNNSGVYVYSLTSPANPAFEGSYLSNANARMVAVNGSYMYVAAEDSGMIVLQNPQAPVWVGSYHPSTSPEYGGFSAYGVTYSTAIPNKVFVAHWGGGVTAVDVITPAVPTYYGRMNTPGQAYEAFVWDANNLLVADYYSLQNAGLTVVGVSPDPDTQTPYVFKLNGAYPNPFNAATMISFTMPVPGKVDVVVYDAMGRAIALPFSGTLSAGEHRVLFDASNLSSGMYFLQVSSPWGEQSGKMVLLK
jgi:hypothetical protein